MDDGSISLSAGFAPGSADDWRVLVDKTLAGASFEKRLISRTYDGLKIQPLYTATGQPPDLAQALRRRSALDANRPWDIRVSVDHPDPASANALALGELEDGATSLLVRVDPAGHDGVSIASKADLQRTLEGVLFDLAPVALEAGYRGPMVAGWLHDVAQSKTLKPRLQLHLDPIGMFAQTGVSPGPIKSHVELAAQTARRLDVATAFIASGQTVHEAGGSEALEVGFMAAVGVAYLKAMLGQGASAGEALDKICLGLCADADYFTSIAKLRAARTVWARIGAALTTDRVPIRIEARSSRRMLSRLDPWVNMLRLTSAAFGASVGGANAVVLDAFTQPLGRPTVFARRNARNIQLVLMEEAHLGLVADPAGGAWFIESFTDQIARAAWRFFQEIEAAGGAVAALTSDLVGHRTREVCDQRKADIAQRKAGLVGVTEFANLSEAPVDIDQVDLGPISQSSAPPTLPGEDGVCAPLVPWRASLPFEKIRTRADTLSVRPRAFLATLGSLNDYSGRVSFARNVLAAGGIDCLVVPVADDLPGDLPVAVICGSDAGYDAGALEALETLKARGVERVYLAGRPRTLEPSLTASGLDGFLFAGVDIQRALETLINHLNGGAGLNVISKL